MISPFDISLDDDPLVSIAQSLKANLESVRFLIFPEESNPVNPSAGLGFSHGIYAGKFI